MTSEARPLHGFQLVVEFQQERVVLGLVGQLDASSSPELAAVLDALFDRGHDEIVMDLAGLVALDGRGVEAIESAAHRLKAVQGELVLRGTSQRLRQLLAINGLTELVRLEDFPVRQVRLGPEETAASSQIPVGTLAEMVPLTRSLDALPIVSEVFDDSLRLVVNLARKVLSSADGVSVSLLRDGQIKTVAASDRTVLEMDAGQYATGEGPCLSASLEGRWFHIDSLTEETRWPAFVPVAQALGIKAILSNPLTADGRPIGALNIYSRVVGAFGPLEAQLAATIAEETSVMLFRSRHGLSGEVVAARLHGALRSREVIAQAQGIVMDRASVGEQAAFDHLRRFAQVDGRTLRERAEDIVASTRWPLPDEGERRLEQSSE